MEGSLSNIAKKILSNPKIARKLKEWGSASEEEKDLFEFKKNKDGEVIDIIDNRPNKQKVYNQFA